MPEANLPNEIIRRIKLAGSVLLKGDPPKASRKTAPAITPEEVQEVKAFFPLEKFFVFGHARSGTTLLARLLRVHPEVHCNYQAHFFTRPPLLNALVADPEVSGWLARRSNRWNHGRDLSPLVLRVAADFILEREARPLGKRIVGDKSPNSLNDGESVRLMQAVYPDARLIFIARDGRDAALSHRFQAFIDSPQHLSPEDLRIREDFTKDPAPYLCGERSVFTEKGIRRAAQGWVRNLQQTHQAGQELYGDRYLALRYEDLLNRPWEEMCRVWGFLGGRLDLPELPGALSAEMGQNPDAEWQQKKAGDIAQPLQKGKQGGWREMFTRRDREIFHEIAGDTLRTWGYELNPERA
jgi:hypothetical protein